MNTLGSIKQAFINLLYPPLCLHCQEVKRNETHLLCDSCVELLELIDPSERCPQCFSADYCSNKRLCSVCLQRPPLLNGIAAAFDYVGPAASLVRKLKYSNQPHLAKGCAAYLAAQFLRLNWPLPDIIVPVPIALTHLFERGYNQSLELSRYFAETLNRPVLEVLTRKSGDYSQAGLSRQQRCQLNHAYFRLKERAQLQDKSILLIDDVTTTGSTIRQCAEVLMEACPASIYGLTFCRAIK